MLLKIGFSFLVLCIATAFSASYQVTIEGLDLFPNKGREPHFVMLSDGRAGVVQPYQTEIFQKIREHYRKEEIVQIELDKNHNVLKVRPVKVEN